MGKTKDLLKKIRDTKGPCHAKTGTIKDRNVMDLTEAEDIKKSWQEYTEELYKEDLHDPDNHSGVTTIWNWWNLENSAVATGLEKSVFFLKNIYLYLFIYLDALGLGGGRQDL